MMEENSKKALSAGTRPLRVVVPPLILPVTAVDIMLEKDWGTVPCNSEVISLSGMYKEKASPKVIAPNPPKESNRAVLPPPFPLGIAEPTDRDINAVSLVAQDVSTPTPPSTPTAADTDGAVAGTADTGTAAEAGAAGAVGVEVDWDNGGEIDKSFRLWAFNSNKNKPSGPGQVRGLGLGLAMLSGVGRRLSGGSMGSGGDESELDTPPRLSSSPKPRSYQDLYAPVEGQDGEGQGHGGNRDSGSRKSKDKMDKIDIDIMDLVDKEPTRLPTVKPRRLPTDVVILSHSPGQGIQPKPILKSGSPALQELRKALGAPEVPVAAQGRDDPQPASPVSPLLPTSKDKVVVGVSGGVSVLTRDSQETASTRSSAEYAQSQYVQSGYVHQQYVQKRRCFQPACCAVC
ncbi:hypothetical protein B484DRAFT_458712 [Ochromonadaceae sp. CCMP2298]|nr:hypothetical protein B484DRAFT_458712 [Ochromonadaceae sp. CCMP2298]